MKSDTYKIPGNYYCNLSATVKTLKNVPVGITSAFALKVENGNGVGYPTQIFKSLDGIIVNRVYIPYQALWSDDVSYLRTSDLGYVLAEATTTGSEAVVVSQAPNSPFFIPVIIGHSMANLVKEYVFWDGSKWMFISDTAQTTAIRFYKYPV